MRTPPPAAQLRCHALASERQRSKSAHEPNERIVRGRMVLGERVSTTTHMSRVFSALGPWAAVVMVKPRSTSCAICAAGHSVSTSTRCSTGVRGGAAAPRASGACASAAAVLACVSTIVQLAAQKPMHEKSRQTRRAKGECEN